LNEIIYKIANEKQKEEALIFLMTRYKEVGYIDRKEGSTYADEFVSNSVYFVAIENSKVVGVIRLVLNSPIGLPVVKEYQIFTKFAKILENSKTKTAEIGNLAALPGKQIGPRLYKIAIRYAIKNGYKILVAGIDQGLYIFLRKRYWILWPFYCKIADSKHYIGSTTVPILIRINIFMLSFLI
jgi:hypothetical protein